jgi:DNA-directed RNA polymerase subunit RPC12/RpoP
MPRAKWKDEIFVCKKCNKKLRRGGFGDQLYALKLCPQCYTKELMKKRGQSTQEIHG